MKVNDIFMEICHIDAIALMARVGVSGAEVFGKMASSALSGMNSLAASIEDRSV